MISEFKMTEFRQKTENSHLWKKGIFPWKLIKSQYDRRSIKKDLKKDLIRCGFHLNSVNLWLVTYHYYFLIERFGYNKYRYSNTNKLIL